ncbi:hypothetical protein SAY87_025354 [Trapa incisa]|uniref:Uncharacterized protein n=1 Tax=Trapa incisa TaxID=236973 RepID=A0AAN7GEC3_9MYRT|nr:hypothetical protein SAY87_025354 [Trapa incisa]
MGAEKNNIYPIFHFHLPNFHIHHHQTNKGIPKGCLAILVGQGEDQKRFVIPVAHINHPRFLQLLKEAEEEYGFEQKGPITIPCHVEEFRSIRDLIDRESLALHYHHPHHQGRGGGHGRCFSV